MKSIEKDFVPKAESIELKHLGFIEACHRGWDADGKIWYHPDSSIVTDNPTFSQAFRFFRDKYGLFIRSDFDVNYLDKLDEFQTTYFFSILKMEESLVGFKPLGRLNNEKSYEEAELECLKKLIEIVKSKKED